MTILFLLIPLAVVLMGTAIVVFLWALRQGQFDDLDSPGMQVVLDDDSAPPGSRMPQAPSPSADARTASRDHPPSGGQDPIARPHGE